MTVAAELVREPAVLRVDRRDPDDHGASDVNPSGWPSTIL
jgi:hypothetical protein